MPLALGCILWRGVGVFGFLFGSFELGVYSGIYGIVWRGAVFLALYMGGFYRGRGADFKIISKVTIDMFYILAYNVGMLIKSMHYYLKAQYNV